MLHGHENSMNSGGSSQIEIMNSDEERESVEVERLLRKDDVSEHSVRIRFLFTWILFQ